jgi:hypothetical protein
MQRDPHQPYRDIILSEEELLVVDVERMEGEGKPMEGDLGLSTPNAVRNITCRQLSEREVGKDQNIGDSPEKELMGRP